MFGLLWLVMVRMLRFLEIPSTGQRVTWLTNPLRYYNFNILDNYNNNAGEVKHVAGGGSDVNELQTQSTANKQHENEFALQADYNSNCSYPENSTTCTDKETGNNKRRRGDEQNQTTVEISHMSTTSSNDEESLTTNDVSDYQWFPDYVYGDNSNATNISQSYHRPSIFSMLSYSSDVHELNYEAISRNIDANLAEIDMEDFRSEDINSILAIPAMYCGASEFHSSGSHGEQAASLSASIMAHFEDEGSTSTDFYHNNQHLSISINSDSTDMSVCKSEQLFSPIKESDAVGENGHRENNPSHRHNPNDAEMYEAGAAPHPTTFSIDSLDCDSYDEQELILTCQTNVDNYTIAFEGSMSRDSEDSDYHDEAVVCETSDTESWSNLNLFPKKLPNFKLRNSGSVDGSLVQSDFVYTTWTKLRHGTVSPQPSSANKRCHQKYPSRLNRIPSVTIPCNKSQSLPNLCRKYNPITSFKLSQLNISTTESILDQSQRCVPLYDISSSTASPTCSLQSLSLMRLFMQNRTNSSSSCTSSTGVFGSITHSLSSGTLQHQMEASNSQLLDSNNLSERLQNYLGSKMGAGNEINKKRPVSPLGSPIEEVDESDNTTTTTSNKMTINTIKNKNSDDSIEEDTGSENELEHDGAKIPVVAIDITQATQTSGICNISNTVVNDEAGKVRRGDSGVSLSSACTSYGDAKSDKCVKNKSGKNAEKSGSVTITMFTTRGTQLPVHVCDEAIQTSCKGEWLERILSKCSKLPSNTQITVSEETNVGNDKMEGDDSEENKTQSTIYVCYPNYSLPDLSFLKELSKEKPPPKVHLSPSKTSLQSKKNNNAVRPKSCPGFNHLHPNVNNLTRIEDWDSLNVLLPQNVKELIRNWKTTEIFGDENPSMSKRSSESSSQEKSDLEKVPRGILRRSRTESGPVDIKRFVVPKELHALYSQMHSEAIAAETTFKQGTSGNCKCPLSGELTALLGISQEQCDCEHSLKSTLNHLGTLENQFSDIDLQDDVKNKKVVSFSSKNQTCFSCESQAENVLIKAGEVETAEIQDIPKIKFSISGKDDDVLELNEAGLKKVPSWDSKLDLVNGITDAVNILNHHFSQAKDPHSKILMGSTLHTPSTGHKVLQCLCPALFQILNDGLQPSIYNIFGHMENSVWMVVEALTQSGNCSKQMSDLVVHVNNEQNILEKKMKFNAFIFGLLNIRSLATWFSLLGSSEQILSKHYSPSAFLYRAVNNRKILFDNLLIAFQTLSLLPFDLDLAFELHLSNPPQLSPSQPQRICFSSSPTKHKLQVDPYVPEEKLTCKPIKTSKLVHRHSCGLLLDELIKEQTDCGTPETNSKERKFDRLRRGLSQDSAVAKQTSESTHIPNASSRSSEEQHREGWALRDLPKRPWSYAQEVEFDLELSSQNSSKEMCSNSSGANTDSSSIELIKEGELKETSLEKADGGKSEPKSVLGEAEKGSLDARIAERKENADKSECKIALSNEKEALDDPDSVQFKQLQMRWEILSGASPLNGDKKKVSNPNSRSRIPRLVMQLPTSPSPKLKQRIEKQLSNEQLLQPVTIAVNSNCPAPNSHNAIVQINRTSLGQHGATHPEPNVHAKNIAVAAAAAASSEKSPVKKRSNVGHAATKPKSKAAGSGNSGICKGASGGASDDTVN